MKRLTLSAAGGIALMLIIVALLTAANHHSWPQAVFFWMLAFPGFIFYPLFPPHPKPNDLFPGFPTGEAMTATLIFDFVFYSLLVYLILWWRGRKRPLA